MAALRRWTACLLLLPFCLPASADPPTPERQRQLVHLVRQDCGACHGLTLRGGLGSALTPEVLRGKPTDSLVATVLHGRPGTAMPPFKSLLSEAEARWIIAQLMNGFPHEE
jgi:cytochrome c55X